MTKVLDHGYVREITEGCWGSDELIIESARMSTDGGFRGWGPIHTAECNDLPAPFDCNCDPKPGDEKLLRYLWKHKHTTPFEMAGATFEIYAPIFVIREWHRHRTQSYNEMSGRYIELPNDYYVPSAERVMAAKQSSTNKQGSEKGFDALDAEVIRSDMDAVHRYARDKYEELLEMGVAREVARMVLPVSQYSRFRASANLWNWFRFLQLRLDPHAQWEIREYARAVAEFVRGRFPRTYTLFEEAR